MKSFSETRAGKNRSVNQDCFLCEEEAVGELPNLFIVADGLGGHNGGDFASRFCVENVKDYILNNRGGSIISTIRSAIKAANEGIREKTKTNEELKGCGTTVVLATIKDGILYIANVGDSRLYVVQKGRLTQITEDHSVVEEMVKKKRGLIRIRIRLQGLWERNRMLKQIFLRFSLKRETEFSFAQTEFPI